MKSIFILLFLSIFYQTYSQSIKRAHFPADVKCGLSEFPDWNCSCIFDNNVRTIGDLNFKGTHGRAYPSACIGNNPFNCRTVLPAQTNSDGTKSNAGFLMVYDFKQNYNYDVYIYANGAYEYVYGYQGPNRYPALSAQLTNNSQPSLSPTCQNNVFVPSTPTNDPYFTQFPHLSFSPGICYNGLWVVTEPNPLECNCSVILDSIRVEESLPIISIVHRASDPDAICFSNEYRILINGAEAPLNNVNWTVSNISPTTGTIVSSVTNGNTITLSKVSTGTIKLTASVIPNACGAPPITVNQTITVGTPPPSLKEIIYRDDIFVAKCVDQTLGYNWSHNGITDPYQHSYTYNGGVDQCGVPYRLDIQSFNSCGTSAIVHATANAKCNPGGPQRLADSSIQLGNSDSKKTETVATETTSTKVVSVYPNPAANTISVAIPNITSHKAYIKVYSILGKQLKTIIPVSTTTNISIGAFANGAYIIEIFDGTNSIKKKVIKN